MEKLKAALAQAEERKSHAERRLQNAILARSRREREAAECSIASAENDCRALRRSMTLVELCAE